MFLSGIKTHSRAFSRIRLIVATGALISLLSGLAIAAPPASASVGQDPANCQNPTTWGSKSFNVAGNDVLVELRHSYACQAGWARISTSGNGAPLNMIFSAWNPGQPSHPQIQGEDYTYTVDASPGSQVCAGFQAWSIDEFGDQHYAGWHFAGCYNSDSPPKTFTETVGGPTATWADYSDAGGNEGATIPAGQSVQVACVTQGFQVADGNTNWYLITSSPLTSAYYASADAFYNNGANSGNLDGTPYVDPSVPPC
jgi:hypothetical protein